MNFSREPKEQALVVVEEAPRLTPCNNAEVIRQWWQSKGSEKTQKAYQKDAQRFLACIGEKPLNYVGLDDLYTYQRALAGQGLQPASIARRLSAIKSLLTFGCTVFPRFFLVNVGAAFKIKRGKDALAERILPEEDIHELLALQRRVDDDPFRDRNTVLLRLHYKAALRREEPCRLSWSDVQDRAKGQGQITVYGKGGKTRSILIEDVSLYRALVALRHGAPDHAPVFVSRRRGNPQGKQPEEKRLSPDQVYRIVRKAAKRADIDKPVSPHWFRHAHASHALEAGAPITLVRDTLGHSNLTTTSRYSHVRPNASSGQYLKG